MTGSQEIDRDGVIPRAKVRELALVARRGGRVAGQHEEQGPIAPLAVV